MRVNDYGQPIGQQVEAWSSRPFEPPGAIEGAFARLEPLDPAAHANGLYQAFLEAPDSMWTYLPYGPFDRAGLDDQLTRWAAGDDPSFHVIADPGSGKPLGWAAYLRMDEANGSVEVGHISYSPALVRTTAATEAMWLMMRHAFDALGYRRYEWKCDALNERSRTAAERLGFTFEGVFRNHMVYRGRNRDTAWFSITDVEWPGVDQALRGWLSPANHRNGVQIRPLASFRPES